MNRSWRICCLLLALAIALGGCPKKKPSTASDTLSTRTTTVDPSDRTTEVPTPSDATGADQTADPLAGDLQAANEYASSRGLLGDIYFDFDRYDLRNDARERLSRNAEFLKSHPEFVVTIEGHCDDRGTNEYNLSLGDRRANAARDYLVSLGVGGDRLRTISYGEERGVCSEQQEGCWSKNRRSHFLISSRANVG